MAKIKGEVRSGVYYDSVVLMQLQRALTDQPGVLDAGVMMGTDANKDLLAQSELLAPEVQDAGADDMLLVIKAEDESTARDALAKVDELIAIRRGASPDEDYRPKSLESASKMLSAAQWVLISVPGRYAARVARQALDLNKHVFLYSDNVDLQDEIRLKQTAAEKGLLVMGPDCGTAIVNGIGLGFANKVRPGPIGLVAASGTGLQQVTARIHQMGGGITQALGTGGRDLTEAVGAVTAQQGLDLLSRDPQTKVIVLISKPPSTGVANELVRAARLVGKPVVVDFIGYATSVRKIDNVNFATSIDEAAGLAVQIASTKTTVEQKMGIDLKRYANSQRFLRGLFSGGTLAYEAMLILQDYLLVVFSNAPLKKEYQLLDSLVSQENTILDLGEDEFTVGRLHPMMDNDLRIRRLEVEADQPDVAVILMDVVLGSGAHPDPAGELSPAIREVREQAEKAGRYLEVVAIVTGTDEDPQDMHQQEKQLEAAGAKVFTSNDAAARYVGRLVAALNQNGPIIRRKNLVEVDLKSLTQPLAAINVGLESFTESLISQDAQVIQVDWRPPLEATKN